MFRIAVQLYSNCVPVCSAHAGRGRSMLAACMCVGACVQDTTYVMSGGGGGKKSSLPGGDRGELGS